jgi:adenine phosphoribosyltransferase
MEPLVDPVAAARTRLLTAFRWLDGHADVAGLFRDPELLRLLGPALAAPFAGSGVSVIVALEATGFIPATLAAQSLGAGLALLRKHPRPGTSGLSVTTVTRPDWRRREHRVQLRRDHVIPADRALIVDEWVETGSQATSALALIRRCGAELVGTSALVDDVRDGSIRERLRLVGVVRRDELD